MQPGTPSATAISVASLRAAHLHLFNSPKIHKDTFALQLSGAKGVEDLRARLEKSKLPQLQRVSAYFACRHRFSEDRMWAALSRGVRQVVLLGAGLFCRNRSPGQPTLEAQPAPNTRPFHTRRQIRASRLRVSEPRGRVAFCGRADRAADLLRMAWCVTQYISEPAAITILSLAARHALGSEIVFDVIVPFQALTPDELQISSAAQTSSHERGEPWMSFYRPEQIASRLLALGFASVQPLTPEDASRYYIGQPAGVTPLRAWQLVSAVV